MSAQTHSTEYSKTALIRSSSAGKWSIEHWKRSRNADSDDETSDTSRAQTADTASSSAAVWDGSPKPLAAADLEHARVETHLEAATFDNSAAAVDLADSAVPRLFGRDEAQIQRSLEGTDTTIDEVPGKVLDVLSNGGQPLNQPVQRALEERMDADFSDVRLHTGGTAAKAAEAIDAKAFTCGNDIVFNSGEYDPESPEGQHLLAHELAHVKQQNGGAPISMMPQEGANLEIDPDPQLEREADAAAEQALSGEEPLVVSRMGTDVHIQRMPAGAPVKGAEGGAGLAGRVSAIEESLSELEPLKSLADRTDELKAQLDGSGDGGVAKKVGAAGIWGSVGAALTQAQHAGADALGVESLLGNLTGDAHADAVLGTVIAGTTAAKVTGGKEGISALKKRAKAWFSEWRAKSDEDDQKSREEDESEGTLDSVRNLVG
ncbi:DUF4157 domain protein [Natrialba magadii ATCC 43099]|uniref:DUF4157 domain protein n=1 Tax=Natrialba magadii (strain ATCC 43099 / DSM 3394 / CCM 3739 / CIP 104546 / IAM 13178 / JCM 8861 / NBRC 102185 / NCIMB 2190 / MS3) TaxID=547559 RepID=D3SZK3_NATMM|nr:DUF4157 domain-containing protein [Natrialba magadii]ADD04337.1 DUF4157 domain protein [Natrialba magadii ATCC 43099]ELY26732.1 hypothetical protein C500_16275 [Natrialba magadii ATCC 43099]